MRGKGNGRRRVGSGLAGHAHTPAVRLSTSIIVELGAVVSSLNQLGRSTVHGCTVHVTVHVHVMTCDYKMSQGSPRPST